MNKVYFNGIFHTMVSKDDTFYAMEIEKGRIKNTYSKSEFENLNRNNFKLFDLNNSHVYPCLIDGHTHMLLTIAQLAMGFNICEITKEGVKPNSIKGIEERIRKYVNDHPNDKIIALNNYIQTAIDERRLPNKNELDLWSGNRAIVIYNIDGHSTALSSKMLQLIGMDPDKSNGILTGEENERAQGRIINVIGNSISLKTLAHGIGIYHNKLSEYGITMVGALEGNGDSKKDPTTKLIINLAKHFDSNVRLYLQYVDYERVNKFAHIMSKKRVGGCGDWEMDGAVGSHSASFDIPYIDTNTISEPYYTQDFVDELCKKFDENGYQISSHAIGSLGIKRIAKGLLDTKSHTLHRIDHMEFIDDETLNMLKNMKLAIFMQPGYAYIDKRYLNTYRNYLNEKIIDNMKLKSIYDSNLILCGSSDSPVQDMDPYLQMQGMTDFYIERESITPYEAMTTYTKNAAMGILEEENYGTLEKGKYADFFVSNENFFELDPKNIISFRPIKTYYRGKEYIKKKGTLGELILMFIRNHKKL